MARQPLREAVTSACDAALADVSTWTGRFRERFTQFGPVSKVTQLETLLRDSDWKVRCVAAISLGKLSDAALPQAPLLGAALKDSDYPVRVRAAEALRLIGPAAAASQELALSAALEDRADGVRREAAQALGCMRAAASHQAPRLAAVLNDKEEGVRWRAAEALGLIGPAAAPQAPVLAAALKDKNVDVQRRAAEALGLIGPTAAAQAEAVSALLASHNADLHSAASTSLRQMLPKVPMDNDIIRKEGLMKVVKAAELAADLRSTDSKVRRDAAAALGELGGLAAAMQVPHLEILLKRRDVNEDIRGAAVSALLQLGPEARKVAIKFYPQKLEDAIKTQELGQVYATYKEMADSECQAEFRIAGLLDKAKTEWHRLSEMWMNEVKGRLKDKLTAARNGVPAYHHLVLASSPEHGLDGTPELTIAAWAVRQIGGYNIAGDATDRFHKDLMDPAKMTEAIQGWRQAWQGKCETGLWILCPEVEDILTVYSIPGGPETQWERRYLVEQFQTVHSDKRIEIKCLDSLEDLFTDLLKFGENCPSASHDDSSAGNATRRQMNQLIGEAVEAKQQLHMVQLELKRSREALDGMNEDMAIMMQSNDELARKLSNLMTKQAIEKVGRVGEFEKAVDCVLAESRPALDSKVGKSTPCCVLQ